MRQTKWDTELGRQMWLEGKSDTQIADEFRISVGTVNSYRKKHWENGGKAKGKKANGETAEEAAQVANLRKKMMDEVEPGTCQVLRSVPGVPGPLPPVDKKALPQNQPDNTPQEDTKTSVVGSGSMQIDNERSDKAEPCTSHTPSTRKFEIMEVVEVATEHLSGIMAVCTASAIENLMYWRYPEDLIRAKQSIEYMLKKMGEVRK